MVTKMKTMSKSRIIELLGIELQCVKRASGLELDLSSGDWIQTGDICDRDCEHCDLVQDSAELLNMYCQAISALRRSG